MERGTLARALRRDVLQTSFDAAGVGFKLLDGPIAPSAENLPIFQMDVNETARSREYLRLWPGAPDNEIEVTGWDRSFGQAVLRVREAQRPFVRRLSRNSWRGVQDREAEIVAQGGTVVGVEKYHFLARFLTPDVERRYLCGRDEQRLFVAQLPLGEHIESVEAAHLALIPNQVRAAEARWPGSVVRQGEWFFIPPSPADVIKLSERLARDPFALRRERSVGPGGEARPHVADEVVRVRRGRPQHRGPGHTRPSVPTATFARGEVRHVDHFPLWLPEFRRVVLNRAAVQVREEALRLRWID